MAGLFGWGAKRPVEPPAPERPLETTVATVVLQRFLTALAPRQAPVLLDLGPAVGANVSFLGEQLACKLLIGDLFHEVRDAGGDGVRTSLVARLERTVTGQIDAVLCWDAFDYLDRPTAQAVAEFLAARLRPGGVVHGYFATAPGTVDQYTRYVIQSPTSLQCRHESIAPRKRCVLSTRDLAAMFTGAKVMESVLLKSQRREILLRKG
ncbi:MAG TPA: hypothetical protein VN700_09125 [Vicinamibacterales bacterium]|nr:hypothetical protein [Vicinamibacterales bacterium]